MALENIPCPHCGSRALHPFQDPIDGLVAECVLCARVWPTNVGLMEIEQRARAQAAAEASVRCYSHLRRSHMDILCALRKHPRRALTPEQLVRQTHMDETRVISGLRYLQERNLVTTTEHVAAWRLTEKGLEAVA